MSVFRKSEINLLVHKVEVLFERTLVNFVYLQLINLLSFYLSRKDENVAIYLHIYIIYICVFMASYFRSNYRSDYQRLF